jgi:hypothetical protein
MKARASIGKQTISPFLPGQIHGGVHPLQPAAADSPVRIKKAQNVHSNTTMTRRLSIVSCVVVADATIEPGRSADGYGTNMILLCNSTVELENMKMCVCKNSVQLVNVIDIRSSTPTQRQVVSPRGRGARGLVCECMARARAAYGCQSN